MMTSKGKELFPCVLRDVLFLHELCLYCMSVDHSRVKVTLKTSNQDTDYINANFIKVLNTFCLCVRAYVCV